MSRAPARLVGTPVPSPLGADAAYEFGAFQLSCGERVLWHLGQRLAVRGKPFEVLTLLVQNAGHTLTKRELLNALWPDVAVHENNIAVAVRTIRRALQEHEPDTVFIETVPGRGYRWVQPARAIVAPRVSSASLPASPFSGVTVLCVIACILAVRGADADARGPVRGA